MSKSTYNTRQKQLIYDFLLSNKGELFTCDEIAQALRESGNAVGKATLYRFLEGLVLSGDARKIVESDKKSAAFQLLDKEMDCHGHMHMKCSCCGKFVHLGCDFMKEVGEHVKKHHGFKIDNSKTVIYGLCNDCLGKEID